MQTAIEYIVPNPKESSSTHSSLELRKSLSIMVQPAHSYLIGSVCVGKDGKRSALNFLFSTRVTLHPQESQNVLVN